jgi:hypothetical protein
MQMWEYADGTEVRYKPLGDKKRAGPTFSVEVKKDPSMPDMHSDDVAFKVDAQGRAVPKNDKGTHNPYCLATNDAQYNAFEDAVLKSVHFALRVSK